ncbi:MAG: hypothetical protein WDO73_09400 [Ignavibacteriota bacterium]
MPSRPQKRRQPTPSSSSILPLLERRSSILAVVLVLIASLRIVSTYTVFNHTTDETAHIASGMEWLDRGVYRYEPQHPPLARVAAAMGPYLLGIRSQGTREQGWLRNRWRGRPKFSIATTITISPSPWRRLGILPFFWVACAGGVLVGKARLRSPR